MYIHDVTNRRTEDMADGRTIKGEVSSKMTYIFIGHFELAYFLENFL